jgi:hypothetical protein
MKPLNLAAFYDVHKINVGHSMIELWVYRYCFIAETPQKGLMLFVHYKLRG